MAVGRGERNQSAVGESYFEISMSRCLEKPRRCSPGKISARTKANRDLRFPTLSGVIRGGGRDEDCYLLEFELPYPVNGAADRLLHPAHPDNPQSFIAAAAAAAALLIADCVQVSRLDANRSRLPDPQHPAATRQSLLRIAGHRSIPSSLLSSHCTA